MSGPHPAHRRRARREDPLTGGVRGRGRAGAPRPDRGRRRHRARLPARRGGVGAAVGGPGGRRARRRHPARVAAGRRPAGAQGRLHHDRHAHHLRIEDPRGLAAAVRRHRDGAAACRRDHDPGQDEHGRVRHGLVHRVLGVRAHPQPVGHRPHPGWLRRRLGRGARCLRGPAVDRHGHRRLDPPARGDDGHGGGEADLRRRLPLRPRGLRVVAGPGRPLRAHGARRRAAARGDRRVRPARLHLDRRTGAVGRRGRAGRGVRRPHGSARRRGPRAGRRGLPAGRRARLPRRGGAVGEARRRGRRGQLPALRVRPGRVLPDPPQRGVVQPRPVRRDALRPPRRRRCLCRGGHGAHPRGRLRPRGQAADHPRHVRALVGLLRRLLRAGAEGPHTDRPRLRRGVRAGGRAGLAHGAHHRVPDRRQGGRPAGHVPQRPRDDPDEPRRHRRDVRAVRARRGGRSAGRAADHGPGAGRGPDVPGRRGLRGRARRRRRRPADPAGAELWRSRR